MQVRTRRYSPRHSRAFLSSVPPGYSPLRLPLGVIVVYPTGRPSIRLLTREIAALGYGVSGFPLHHTDLRPLTPGVWHCAVVIGDIILFIVAPPRAVVVGFVLVVLGPERLRFFSQRARLRQR